MEIPALADGGIWETEAAKFCVEPGVGVAVGGICGMTGCVDANWLSGSLILREIRAQREQPAKQATASREILRFVIVEQTHFVKSQTALLIRREASVAAR